MPKWQRVEWFQLGAIDKITPIYTVNANGRPRQIDSDSVRQIDRVVATSALSESLNVYKHRASRIGDIRLTALCKSIALTGCVV